MLTALLCAVTVNARAEDSPYCRRVSARAQSEAALLWAPRLFVQGLRYPSGFDIGPMTPNGYQLRVGASYSLLDPWKALQLGAAADAECAVYTVQHELEELLESSKSLPEERAYTAQAAFLTAQQTAVDAIVQRAQTRLKERTITLYELNHLLSLADHVERKTAQASGLAARRAAETSEPPSTRSAHALGGELARRRNTHEQKLSAARAYDAWALRVLGGVIPLEKEGADWFGWVELSYSLGGIARSGAETRYREARQAELESDPHELPAVHKRLQEQQAQQAEQAAIELRVIDKRLKYLTATVHELQAAGSPQTYELDAIAIERLSVEAERVYLTTLIDALKQEGSAQRD
jgi:hypothetical protein